jgi:ribosome-associated protein
VTASLKSKELAAIAAKAAFEKLATDVKMIDVSSRFPLSDIFLIASVNNVRQAQAVSDAIEEELNKIGVKAINREGNSESHWLLIDFSEILVHIQLEEDRDYYGLERLWKDCPIEELHE